MIYLIAVETPAGHRVIREYQGGWLWDVVADAEADTTFEPGCRITHAWPFDEAPADVLRGAGLPLPH